MSSNIPATIAELFEEMSVLRSLKVLVVAANEVLINKKVIPRDKIALFMNFYGRDLFFFI
jgi:hypothetical protein